MDTKENVIIYSDGGCSPNPGTGSWAAVFISGSRVVKEISGRETDTTNQRMELTAVVRALESLESKCSIDLYCDSRYVVRVVTKVAKKLKKNKDLLAILYKLLDQHEVRCHWVKGHSGNQMNERADQLCQKARHQFVS